MKKCISHAHRHTFTFRFLKKKKQKKVQARLQNVNLQERPSAAQSLDPLPHHVMTGPLQQPRIRSNLDQRVHLTSTTPWLVYFFKHEHGCPPPSPESTIKLTPPCFSDAKRFSKRLLSPTTQNTDTPFPLKHTSSLSSDWFTKMNKSDWTLDLSAFAKLQNGAIQV